MRISGLLKYTCIFFFFICSTVFLIGRGYYPNNVEKHPVYSGVKFIISGSLVKDHSELLKDPLKLMEGVPPSLDDILENLIQRFNEMVSYYNSNKTKLPSCLREYLDTFLQDLKNGNRKLDIWWWNYDIPWNKLSG